MPEISYLDGIIVFMYFMDVGKHHGPHFHFRKDDIEASMSLDGNILESNPKMKKKYIEKAKSYCIKNKEAILINWNLCLQGKHPKKIIPHR